MSDEQRVVAPAAEEMEKEKDWIGKKGDPRVRRYYMRTWYRLRDMGQERARREVARARQALRRLPPLSLRWYGYIVFIQAYKDVAKQLWKVYQTYEEHYTDHPIWVVPNLGMNLGEYPQHMFWSHWTVVLHGVTYACSACMETSEGHERWFVWRGRVGQQQTYLGIYPSFRMARQASGVTHQRVLPARLRTRMDARAIGDNDRFYWGRSWPDEQQRDARRRAKNAARRV